MRSPRFEYSRHSCVEAALGLLARQADLHKACEPGGRLYEDRWMVFSLPAHDFLLAAMVVCLDLSVRMRSRESALMQGPDHQQQLTAREYRALQTSQRIWSVHSSTSPETRVPALALDLMIKKVAENDSGLFGMHATPSADAAPSGGAELPYAGPMSDMIDGSENIDWGLLDQYFLNLDGTVTDSTL
ncbi:Uu.00g100870.m01.CDS01 [Anthostomella pinea]|uniref:Uu.00g100870.m01.CDS01 n=1 Tax=Anthostomella pinea TaxID=933095 RepID=A0AAI8VDR2_9PEZI|nr:Uu.00g100870.m01.CDS01 [Anthostomella pinea]